MIGTPRRRRDGDAKVRGATRYVADMPVYGLLHARPVLAAEAHARITGIDGSAALEVPGVVAVLTAADLPLAGGSGRSAEPLAREEIVWSGQPVALVIAESEAAAEDGAALVVVDADPLPAVLDIEAALAAGAPPVRVTAAAGEDEQRRGRAHRAARGRRRRAPRAPRRLPTRRERRGVTATRPTWPCASGSTAATSPPASSAPTPSCPARFRTSWVHQAYLEPQSALAWVEPDGELVVHSSTQGAFMAREGLAKALGLSIDRVRVKAGADRRRVRRQADDLRAAGGRRRAQAPAARPDRVRPPRGLRGRQPGARRADRPRARRDPRRRPDGDPRPRRRRPRRDGGHGRRDDLDDAVGRAVQVARARPDRARRRHEPRVAGGVPGPGRAAGRVRDRVAARSARRRTEPGPDRAAPAQRAHGRRSRPRRPGDQVVRRA